MRFLALRAFSSLFFLSFHKCGIFALRDCGLEEDCGFELVTRPFSYISQVFILFIIVYVSVCVYLYIEVQVFNFFVNLCFDDWILLHEIYSSAEIFRWSRLNSTLYKTVWWIFFFLKTRMKSNLQVYLWDSKLFHAWIRQCYVIIVADCILNVGHVQYKDVCGFHMYSNTFSDEIIIIWKSYWNNF